MKNQTLSLTKKSSFLNQLRIFGFWKIIKGLDFKLAIFFLIVYYLDGRLDLNYLLHNRDSNRDYIISIITASSVLFALTITSLSLILSFSSSKFVEFLHRHDQLSPILFIFWLGNGAYLLSITSSLFYLIIDGCKLPNFCGVLFAITVGIFIYAIINTFYILGIVIKFGHFISAFNSTGNLENK